MKRVVLFLFITLVINNLVAQNITVSTNECLEMLNTIWILSNGSDDAASKSMVEKQFSKFKSHNVVKKMYIRNYQDRVFYYEPEFVYKSLPFFALFLKIDNNVVKLDKTKLDENKDIKACFDPDELDSFISDLSDFYNKSNFHAYYLKNIKSNKKNIDSTKNDIKLIDTNKINDIFGTDIKSVNFIVPLIQVSNNFRMPLVIVNDEFLPLFFSFSDELHHCIVFDENYPDNYSFDLIYALSVKQVKAYTSTSHDLPGALFYFLRSYNNISQNCVYNMSNLITTWMPFLLIDKYYKDDVKYRDYFIDKANHYGFYWHKDALCFMDNYYSNRNQFKTITDYVPQIEGFLCYISSVYQDVEISKLTNPDQFTDFYVTSVFPAHYSVLDLSKENVDIRITFSKQIKEVLSVHINSLHTLTHNVKYKYEIVNPNTLVVSIPVDVIKSIGFYGLKIKAYHVNDVNGNNLISDFIVNYYQP